MYFANSLQNPVGEPWHLDRPLIPIFAPVRDFLPEGPACEVPPPSSPVFLLSADLRAAEEALFAGEEGCRTPGPTPEIQVASPLDVPALLSAVAVEDAAQQPRLPKLKDLKVEVPLTVRCRCALAKWRSTDWGASTLRTQS